MSIRTLAEQFYEDDSDLLSESDIANIYGCDVAPSDPPFDIPEYPIDPGSRIGKLILAYGLDINGTVEYFRLASIEADNQARLSYVNKAGHKFSEGWVREKDGAVTIGSIIEDQVRKIARDIKDIYTSVEMSRK